MELHGCDTPRNTLESGSYEAMRALCIRIPYLQNIYTFSEWNKQCSNASEIRCIIMVDWLHEHTGYTGMHAEQSCWLLHNKSPQAQQHISNVAHRSRTKLPAPGHQRADRQVGHPKTTTVRVAGHETGRVYMVAQLELELEVYPSP